MRWRRKWQPTPVFVPRESQGWWSLVGCHLWGRTESDTTEVTQQQQVLVTRPRGLEAQNWVLLGGARDPRVIPETCAESGL